MNSIYQLAVVIGCSAVAASGSWLLKETPERIEFRCDSSLLKEDEICLGDVPEDVLWIDARSRKEWQENGLPGSILWNMDPSEDAMAMESEAAMAIINASSVVVYCKSEACGTSRQIANKAKALEMGPEIKVLFGGWDALRDSNPAK